ncbi:MAG: AAA family ATPase [Firmicutes bacterium]|nr:AAA family ATPase [Bacillota bacterium]
MLRLSLTIADKDKAYVESLVGFLMDKHPHKFQVNFFTNEEYLRDFLSKNVEKTGILLITPDFYDNLKSNAWESNIPEYKIRMPVLILLTDNESLSASCTLNTVYKYQHGDKLVSDIIRIYESQCKNMELPLKDVEKRGLEGINKTKVISVYSPAGGAGKTTIAVNACIQCAREGMRVFYLNFENISSEPCFFNCNFKDGSCENFSSIIFAIKEKDKNLHVKIEGIKFSDAAYNIHYIPPSDSALEMEEMLPDEVKYLLHQITLTGYYDIIFVDLNSSLNEKNMAVMEESDEVILIHAPDLVSKQKVISFYKELQIYRQKKGLNLHDKIVLAVNKYDDSIPKEIKDDIDEICTIMGITQYFKIPVNNQAMDYQGDYHGSYIRSKAGELNSFNKELRKLVSKYTKGTTTGRSR